MNESIRAREVRAVFPDGTTEVMPTSAALRKARATGWSLAYFLVQKNMDGLLRYFKELHALPRDVELNDEMLLGAFARAFGCADGNKVDSVKLTTLAKNWKDFIMTDATVELEMKTIQDLVEKKLKELSTPPDKNESPTGAPRPAGLNRGVSAGRRYVGMEHWLPLFYSKMATLLDYLPADAVIALDHLSREARDERLAAWLEPEPLDEVTRRRLVSTAMRETRPSHAFRWIATAAAIVVVLAGGLALVTAGGLLFWGDLNRRFRAFDADSGTIVWETVLGGMIMASTITYAVNGRQYVAVMTGDGQSGTAGPLALVRSFVKPVRGHNAIYVFALPEKR